MPRPLGLSSLGGYRVFDVQYDHMLIGVVQLSDIHFRESGNWIQENANSVIDAVGANDQCDAYVVVVSGNVAYSGHANEYLQAAKYLDVIRSGVNLCNGL